MGAAKGPQSDYVLPAGMCNPLQNTAVMLVVYEVQVKVQMSCRSYCRVYSEQRDGEEHPGEKYAAFVQGGQSSADS